MPGNNLLYVGRGKLSFGVNAAYVSPYLLEILSTQGGAPAWPVASGSLIANTGQQVFNARTASAYCAQADGTLTLQAPNTLLYSQQLTNAAWQNYGSATITDNTTDVTDPLGGNTATRGDYLATIVSPGSYSLVQQGTALAIGQTKTFSIYLRCLSGTQTFKIGCNEAAGVGASLTCNLTTAWQRFSFSYTGTLGTGAVFYPGSNPTNDGGGPLAAQTVYMWGAMLSPAASLTPYVATTSAIASPVRVEPQGLRVEGASTNLFVNSTTPGGTGWSLFNSGSSNPTVTQNSGDVTDPAGGNTAAKVVFPAVTGVQASGFFNTAGAALTSYGWVSVYARTLSGTASLDLNVNRAGGGFPHITTITSTWQRFTFQTDGTASNWFLQPQVDAAAQGALPSQTVYFWIPQVENFPHFATSPIPTSGAVAARDADLLFVSNPLNPSNPPTYRMGAKATGLVANWETINNAGSTNARLLALAETSVNVANTNDVFLSPSHTYNSYVWDNAGTNKNYASAGGATVDGSPFAFYSLNTSGTITGSPTLTYSSGAGAGTITTQPTKLWLGTCPGFTAFGFNGWLTDIFVDNK